MTSEVRKKRLPEATGPRGAEDSHLFRERLDGRQPMHPCGGCHPASRSTRFRVVVDFRANDFLSRAAEICTMTYSRCGLVRVDHVSVATKASADRFVTSLSRRSMADLINEAAEYGNHWGGSRSFLLSSKIKTILASDQEIEAGWNLLPSRFDDYLTTKRLCPTARVPLIAHHRRRSRRNYNYRRAAWLLQAMSQLVPRVLHRYRSL